LKVLLKTHFRVRCYRTPCFSRLKQFRHVATRYEKTARNYLAVVTLATILRIR